MPAEPTIASAHPRVARWPPFGAWATVLGGGLILSFTALYNRYPLVYSDTATYLRSTFDGLEVPAEEISRYGAVAAEDLEAEPLRIRSLVEKPPLDEAPSDVAIVGRYVLEHAVLALLAKLAPGALGEIQLTDALDLLAREGRQRQERAHLFQAERRAFFAARPLGFFSPAPGCAGANFPSSSASNSSSVRIRTPSDLAFSYFDPGSAPTTT